MLPRTQTREPQYQPDFFETQTSRVTLGPMTSGTWRRDPRKLPITLARYKFVSKMLRGLYEVAEVGCGDGFGSGIVNEEVCYLSLFDFDPVMVSAARETTADQKIPPVEIRQADIVKVPLPHFYDAVYGLDVIEHIAPKDEPVAMLNLQRSLKPTGVLLLGAPSLESQQYASPISRAGHVNCKSGEVMRRDALVYFDNVFLFGMNDEVVHTGFSPMCHYNFVLCTGPKGVTSN